MVAHNHMNQPIIDIATEPLQPFPPIPVELVLEILEFVASIDQKTAASLTLVSSQIRRFALPFLYHTVILSTSRELCSFLRSISSNKSTPKLAPRKVLRRLVVNLGIFALGSMTAIGAVISLCANVESLACGFSMHTFSQIGQGIPVIIPKVREQHLLGFSCRDQFDPSIIARTTTRLHVQLTAGTLALLSHVHEHLENLTHLAITVVSAPSEMCQSLLSMIEDLLCDNPMLRVLLVQDASFTDCSTLLKEINQWNGISKHQIEVRDVRLVSQKASQSPVRQWESDSLESPAGGLWRDAELVIETRKKAKGHRSTLYI
ncbi:hypothetical protein BDQ12DRAFT_673503 [Crucibulum laeve]|uniref:Uncharacterized protein n=1 Tax=Crucibulum laeve TaxID=68775 RepID=A0A5C3MH75_9AGAR|nr:hypothetical protein BDQ12DRAFT_673503 [Crucibulum laeve]